ncbi:MAG: 4-coumarate--CoA ligase [Pseudomonadota bacterium]
MTLRRSDHLRVVVSLIADELGRARKRAVPPAEYLRWTEATAMGEDGGETGDCLNADSLAMLDLVERVNEFYNLHTIGSEDYLVVAPTLGGWLDVIEETLRRGVENVTFRTSGSGGAPKTFDVPWAEMTQELDALDPMLGPLERVMAWTPPHHLYGFLFSALTPARRDIAIRDARALAPSALGRAKLGDLVVATPFIWRRLLNASAPPAGVLGLSSGAPCPGEVWNGFADSDARLIEIYGSTETGGVGWREAGDAPFALLPHWTRLDGDADGDRLRHQGRDAAESAPDRLAFDEAGRFRPTGRRDDIVQVGGVNVSPAQAEEALRAHPLVADAAVRPDLDDPDRRLKAFIVPVATPLPEGAVATLEAHLAERLAAPSRPARLTFGAEIPRNAMGKLADWAP